MCKLFIEGDPTLWESSTRSLRINDMVTSIRLENYFWCVLTEVARRDEMNVPQMVSRLYAEALDAGHDIHNFTSFLRVCAMRYLRLQLAGEIPRRSDIPIRSLDVNSILDRERRTA